MYYWIFNDWKWIVAIAAAALAFVLILWFIFRRRPSPEEIERQRRLFLAESGRLIDGTSSDIFTMKAPDGRTLIMLLYTYRIGGVDYECSQDVTGLIDPADIRVGFPCSVRYQPGNPQNSIVLAENWSGLREALPVLPGFNYSAAIGAVHR
jgi:hypothetical protein